MVCAETLPRITIYLGNTIHNISIVFTDITRIQETFAQLTVV